MTGISDAQYLASVAQRSIYKSEHRIGEVMEKLSSGRRVNSAKDDASGLAISERMMAQSRGNAQAIANSQSGISYAQTAEGALHEVTEMLQRMRELAIHSANGVMTDADRGNINFEYKALSNEVAQTLLSTEFNGYKMLSLDAGVTYFQVGANNATSNQVRIETRDISASLTSVFGSNVLQTSAALSAIDKLDYGIDAVTSMRGALGVMQKKFSYVITSLRTAHLSSESARSRIVDTDFAKQTAELSRQSILRQSGTAILAQANNMNQRLLSLIQ